MESSVAAAPFLAASSQEPASQPVAPVSAAHPVSTGMRIAIVLAIVLPFLGLIAGICLSWGYGFRWMDLGLLVAMYYVSGIGITLGYHRLFTHRAFETPRPVRLLLAILGSMAVEGPLIKWVAIHRRHHQHSDTESDPHSPHNHGRGLYGLVRGLWHSHMGWMFQADPADLHTQVADLLSDRLLRRVSGLFPLWALLGLLLPMLIAGLISGTWTGALLGFIWGGLARVFLVHHTTWSINSACHVWGRQPFRSNDQSRNNLIFGILALGEGWHNNHHAFPTSARHGLRWWELDLTFALIRLLQTFGLAWNVRVPSPQALQIRAS